MSVTVRFAPSPTGSLHLGNARTALVNWLLARSRGGRLLLRIDDTDRARSQEALVEPIRDDLRWLGLGWDAEVRQSDRSAIHRNALERLIVLGRAYPAYETAEELAAMRAAQRAAGRPPRYDRRALALSPSDRQALDAGGSVPHWRFRLSAREVVFEDLVRGLQRVDLAQVSDPVIARMEGDFPYLFASAIDDLELEVSHVLRGEDHLTNAGVQIDITEALGRAPPAFGHLPLLRDAQGHKLSKRSGAASLGQLREAGVEAGAILGLLAVLGTGRAAAAVDDPHRLLESFDLAAFGTAQPRVDPSELARLTREALREMPYATAQPRLEALGIDGLDDGTWALLRGDLAQFDDIAGWWRILRSPLIPPEGDEPLRAVAAENLAAAADLGCWARELPAATGVRGPGLWRPLRLALTTREHGPPLTDLIAILGRERAVRRLRGETA